MRDQIIISLYFLGQLLLSEAVFLIKGEKRNKFFLRVLTAVVCYAGVVVLASIAFEYLPKSIPLRLLYFVIFFFCSVPAVHFCFAMKWSQIFFVAIAGYSIEHIASSVSHILIFAIGTQNISRTLLYSVFLTLPYIGCAVFFYFALVKRAVFEEKIQYMDKRVVIVSVVNLSICLVLSVVVDDAGSQFVPSVICKIYAILGCSLCLCLQTGLFKEGKMTQENKTLQQMLLFESNQHKISKETIDFINIKCHDLKHQINKLDMQTREGRAKSIAEISEAILIYDSIARTGNDALDIVLMEKKLLCEKYHIKFTYMAEGKGLDMMEAADIYSLFGNMLDNAIESLSAEPDVEKRIMSLTVNLRQQMLYICMENYCGKPVVVKDGEIQTTKKEEPGMHGYGIKSIVFIVNRYGGDVLIQCEDNRFVIEIMLPEISS